ncbi:vomeronasal type-2 receptor 26-like [Spea bombifrons]|uniref:vomeronasal type-2 receptor 26-like n=1 Tax=Spea bombifrons TaxID=233779 RepID=UPI0023494005|nr:vomeronasal type-2 receptor 26-like [Spea bombifrons]
MPYMTNGYKEKRIPTVYQQHSWTRPFPHHYVNILNFLFAVENINNNPDILPNITLGYHLYDSCSDPRKAVKSVLQILSGPKKTIPNYSCTERDKVAGFIGDHYSVTTVPIAQILGIYGYAQISYGATDSSLSDRRLYPHFFRTVQNDHAHYLIIAKILKFFGWTWIGILASDDDAGEKESLILTKYMAQYGICAAFTIKLNIGFLQQKKSELRIIPQSRCSSKCLPGERKVAMSTIHTCCYNCVPCSEGEISNVSDSENCIKCPEDQWPNKKKDKCTPKMIEFLSYKDDLLTFISASASLLLCFVAGLILLVFTLFWDTPIVRANNRSLSFILLFFIMLSFLCVFLFLGRPVDITCMLRHTSFGIIFSVAVSCVLAKTLMVCIAFKATKPGSAWDKWVGVRLPNSTVILCSSVQVIINICWLAISPPFQEQDLYSHKGKIIIQCNEGSVIAFYSVLGYMGFLAAVCFIIAFLARSLPDSFNEAKYITFSMLVFCSVWIAMIPAYLSTKGKYMVAVEIFAILMSSSGLLSCIFFPKCYLILFRPETNTKTYVLKYMKT